MINGHGQSLSSATRSAIQGTETQHPHPYIPIYQGGGERIGDQLYQIGRLVVPDQQEEQGVHIPLGEPLDLLATSGNKER